MAAAPKVKIKITPSLSEPVTKWVARYNESAVVRMGDALFDGKVLVLHAEDVADFIKISCEEDSSEIDAHRLHKLAGEALKASLARARSRWSIRSLESALDMLSKAKVGEWKDEDLAWKPRKYPVAFRFKQV